MTQSDSEDVDVDVLGDDDEENDEDNDDEGQAPDEMIEDVPQDDGAASDNAPDDVIEDTPGDKARRKRKSRSATSKPRKNAVVPRRFSFSVTIVEEGQDFDIDGSRSLLKDFIENHTEIARQSLR